jgi:hypothetical protein
MTEVKLFFDIYLFWYLRYFFSTKIYSDPKYGFGLSCQDKHTSRDEIRFKVNTLTRVFEMTWVNSFSLYLFCWLSHFSDKHNHDEMRSNVNVSTHGFDKV